VGRDQIAHVEISRDIARRFKDLYGVEVFPEPQPLLTEFARIPGLDSRKMSKSYKNALEMGEEAESLRAKVMTMFTDPNKKRATDAGNPEGCVVFAFHKLYNPGWQAVDAQCRSGASGCVACKKLLVSLMAPQIEGFRVRRAEYDSNPALVDEILERGAVAARKSAQEVLSGVRRAMRLV
jgi:tryptophanyl-tRNA synthetase